MRSTAANKAVEARQASQQAQTSQEQQKRAEEAQKTLQQKIQTEFVPKSKHDEAIKQKDQELESLRQSKARPRVQRAVAKAAKPEGPKPVAQAVGRKVGRGAYGPNTYYRGQCTHYAKSRRPDLPSTLGNANTWYVRARALGWATGTTPQAGAVGQTKRGMHVVYVEAVLPGGMVRISERNYDYRGSLRTVVKPASLYLYIY